MTRAEIDVRYRSKNADKIATYRSGYRASNREILRAKQWEWRRRTFVLEMIRSAKKRAKSYGVPFDLVPSDILVPEACPLLGITLILGIGSVCPGSPTLDRLIPARGYIRSNIWVISHRANSIKRDATLEEIEMLALNLRATLGAPWAR